MQVLEVAAVILLLIVCGLMALVALSAAALMIAGDIMRRQDGWKDNGEKEAAEREKL